MSLETDATLDPARREERPVREPLLRVEGLRAGYHGIVALWDVSFSVAEGQVVTLLGSNGAGKTTTLRTVSGLLPAVSGSISFDGRDISHARTDQIVELGIVHVPEGRQLWPRMSVRENLELGAYLPRAKARRAESLERVFGLFPRLKRAPQSGRRHAVGRRTADVRPGARLDGPAAAAHARRAEPRPGAAARLGDVRQPAVAARRGPDRVAGRAERPPGAGARRRRLCARNGSDRA